STDTIGGINFLEEYLKENEFLATKEIKKPEDIRKLLNFNTLLMKDSFSKDFRNDFVNFFEKESFLDARPWFYENESGKELKKFFLSEEKMKFTKRDRNDFKLNSPGLYEVFINVNFSDEWKLFTDNGEPSAEIKIEFRFVREPEIESPFYSMPLNGLIGLEGSKLNREGYGTVFEGIAFNLNESLQAARTLEGAGSGAVKAKILNEANIEKLNSDPKTNGNLFRIKTIEANEKELSFTPNLATPVMIKYSYVKDDNPFSVYYSLFESSNPVTTGNTLTYWSGAGNCFDFTGKPVTREFNFKGDRKIVSGDELQEGLQGYAVDWKKSVLEGNIYLRTIFFTPINKSYSLKTIAPSEGFNFITPSNESASIALNGLQGMNLNSRELNSIDSLQGVLNLVEQGKACIASTGNEASFYWNSQAIYKQAPSQGLSINERIQEIDAGSKCIK
ncbi:MAG TPA: hypothetical protein VJK05_05045, partial [archaeon]|nr:hypothetical protein [archaeon]